MPSPLPLHRLRCSLRLIRSPCPLLLGVATRITKVVCPFNYMNMSAFCRSEKDVASPIGSFSGCGPVISLYSEPFEHLQMAMCRCAACRDCHGTYAFLAVLHLLGTALQPLYDGKITCYGGERVVPAAYWDARGSVPCLQGGAPL